MAGKKQIAAQNALRYTDDQRHLNPFEYDRLPLKSNRDNALGSQPARVNVIIDESGARMVRSFPMSLFWSSDYMQIMGDGIAVLCKKGFEEKHILPSGPDMQEDSRMDYGDLHPLETVRKRDTSWDDGARTHHHKRRTWLNSGRVIREMNRKMVKEAFAA